MYWQGIEPTTLHVQLTSLYQKSERLYNDVEI